MVAVFVRLKLTLLRNGLRGGGTRVVLTILAIPFALLMAFACSAGLALLRSLSLATATDGTAVVAVLLAIMWVISPVYVFSSDNTLDPARMALLPVRARDLLPGMAAAAWVGLAPIATALALSGSVIGLGRSPIGAVAATIGALLAAAFSVYLSRAVATAAAAVLRSRRGRDLGTLLTVVTFGSLGVLMSIVPSLLAQHGVFAAMATVCRWLPPGAAAHLAEDAMNASWLLVLADLLIAGGAVLAAVTWWSRGLAKALVSPASAGHSSRSGPPTGLFPRWLRWLPGNRGTAVFARELRYAARSPYRRASIALAVVSGTFLGYSPVLLGGGLDPAAYAGCWIACVYAISYGNPLGYEGRSLWLHHGLPGSSWPDWIGRIAAALTVGAVPAILVSTAGAAFTRNWHALAPAIGISVVILAIQCGVAAIFGVLVPYAMPDIDANPFSTGSGGGIRAVLTLLVSGFCTLVLAAPVLGLAVAGGLGWAPGAPLAVVAAVLYVPVLVLASSRAAAALHDARAPEVLTVVAPRA